MTTSSDLAKNGFMQRLEARKNEYQERMRQRLAEFDGDCTYCFDDPESVCEECDRGIALIAHYRDQEAMQFIQASGLPLRFWQHTFESYPAKGKREVERFVDSWDGKQSLLLTGGYGVGKTGLIAAALRRIAARYSTTPVEQLGLSYGNKERKPIFFASTVSLTDALRAGYNDGTFQQTLNRAKSCRLLVLDDLGSEKASEWVQERLFSIIDDRYGAMLPTWGTSNLGPEQLATQIGERAFWRLIENGQLIQVNGPNLRDRRSA